LPILKRTEASQEITVPLQTFSIEIGEIVHKVTLIKVIDSKMNNWFICLRTFPIYFG